MKPSSPALRTLLASRKFFACDLYTFTLIGGGTLRYCGGDQDVMLNGTLYSAGGQVGPFFDRTDNKSLLHWKIGTATDTLTFDVIPGSALVLGEPFLAAVHQGQFDNAELVLDRLFMPTYGDTSRGAVRMFAGRVAEIDAGRSIATFTVNDHRELMNLNLPRNLIQASCVNNLGDSACGVNTASYSEAGTVAASSGNTNMNLNISTTGHVAGDFNQGKIAFTSGALAGLARGIRASVFNSGSSASITTNGPFPVAPAVGDAFTIYSGCDKSYNGANGCPKFWGSSAPSHFRGEPFTPQPTVAV